MGHYMSNTLLRDTDSMSMAHALEVRVPFVDQEVARMALNLPADWHQHGTRPKALLLDALGDLFPPAIWQRRKVGFTLPFARWMSTVLRPEIVESLSSETFQLRRIGLEPEAVSQVWNAFERGSTRMSWSRPWALYVLRKWCELNKAEL
jgi:asparagine synthase (glutamine-hydrolysing)